MVLVDSLLLHVDDLLLVQVLLLWSHLTTLTWGLTGLHHHERVCREALHTHHLGVEAGRELLCLLSLSFSILNRFSSFLLLFFSFSFILFFLVLFRLLLVEHRLNYMVGLNLDFVVISFRFGMSRIFLIFRLLINIFLNILFFFLNIRLSLFLASFHFPDLFFSTSLAPSFSSTISTSTTTSWCTIVSFLIITSSSLLVSSAFLAVLLRWSLLLGFFLHLTVVIILLIIFIFSDIFFFILFIVLLCILLS